MLTRARQAVTGLAVVAAAVVPVLAAPVAARADVVRDSQAWVLNELNVQPAWSITRGQGVTVAVIDSGVNPDVSDLTGHVMTGPDFSGVTTPMSNPNWGVHGTWMASLIAGHGHGYDGQDGIIGIAPQSKILSVRVITDSTDPAHQAYESQPATKGQRELAGAIEYAVRRRVQVISMSLGYSLPSPQVVQALEDAHRHNIVVVASAGNSGSTSTDGGNGNAPYSFPANYPGVLAVAAVNSYGQVQSFSSENLSVQVAAPGYRVPAQGRDGQYWYVSGTSPACALTAGVVALIRSKYPGLTDTQVISAITRTTTMRPQPGGYNDQIGFGVVDAAAALSEAGRLDHSRPAATGMAVSEHFGGGRAAIGPPPVGPRRPTALILFCVLAVACLALVAYATSRLLAAGDGQPAEAGGGGGARPDGAPEHAAVRSGGEHASPGHAGGHGGEHAAGPGYMASGRPAAPRDGHPFRLPGYTASGHPDGEDAPGGDDQRPGWRPQ